MNSDQKSLKISIVTPVYNSEKFLAETIESVVYQKGDFFIEYKILDNCSTDNSMAIARRYKNLLDDNPWLIKCNGINIDIISEPDCGMYDAINKGFLNATGDIFAYINSDDIYLPGAFGLIIDLFQNNTQVNWLKGITSYINTDTVIYRRGNANLYYREWIKKGVYGTQLYFIQQDSTFWRASLWKKIGNIDPNLKLAGDFYLWLNFAKYTELYTVDVDVSCFRKVDNQLSADLDKYYDEVSKIINDKVSKFDLIKLKIFIYLFRKIQWKTFLNICYRILFPFHKYRYFKINETSNILIKRKTCLID